MPKYEIRFGNVQNHSTFVVAENKKAAIAKALSHHNSISKNQYDESKIAMAEQTSKVPLETVAIPFTRAPSKKVDISIRYLEEHIKHIEEYGKFIIQPDFQRAHVWTEKQQIAFVEFLLRGGKSGRDIYLNCPDWDSGDTCPDTVVVDGLQRLTAVRKFVAGQLFVFDSYTIDDFEYVNNIDLIFHTNNLKTREEVLNWYLEMNSGGTPHTEEELDKVRKMLDNADEVNFRHEQNNRRVHLNHCNQGEYIGSCKYGSEQCPAFEGEINDHTKN